MVAAGQALTQEVGYVIDDHPNLISKELWSDGAVTIGFFGDRMINIFPFFESCLSLGSCL